MKKLLLFILLFPCAVAHAAFAPSAGTTHKGVTVDATTDIYVGTTGAEIYDANLDPYVDALTLTTLASGDIIYFLDATDTLNPKKGDVADLIGIGGSGSLNTIALFTPDGTTLGDSSFIEGSGNFYGATDGTNFNVGACIDNRERIRLDAANNKLEFFADNVETMQMNGTSISQITTNVAGNLSVTTGGELRLTNTCGTNRMDIQQNFISGLKSIEMPNVNGGFFAVDNGLTAGFVPQATAEDGELVDTNLSEDGDGDMDVTGGSHDGKIPTIGITVDAGFSADDQVLDIITSTTVVASDLGVAASRTFTLDTTDMVIGWTYILRWEGANAGELLDTGIYELSGDWRPTDGDTLTITWNGTIVSELARSAN